VIPNFLQTGAWPWLRTSMQAATMVLLVFMLGPHDFGRYATALAIASIIAPLVVGGPSFVYLDSHRAFGCTREQVATVWTRSLLVFGLALAALVAVAMVVLADDRLDWAPWFGIGLAEIALAGFIEIAARQDQAAARFNAMGLWQTIPHALRLLAVIAILALGITVTLSQWVLLMVALSAAVSIAAVRYTVRKDNPRALETLVRFLRTVLRYGEVGVANRVIADADKPLLARMVAPAAAGSLTIAQRLIDVVSLPLQVSVSNALPRLVDASPGERADAWRRELARPIAYALFAGVALFALAPWLRALGPEFAMAAGAMAWLCWLPIVGFARGMLGNAALLAGRGDVLERAMWSGAIARVVSAIFAIGFFGWQGAVASLFLGELVSCLWLLAGRWRPQQPTDSFAAASRTSSPSRARVDKNIVGRDTL
jgi:O-antigen/teichoic acid export membrane protein